MPNNNDMFEAFVTCYTFTDFIYNRLTDLGIYFQNQQYNKEDDTYTVSAPFKTPFANLKVYLNIVKIDNEEIFEKKHKEMKIYPHISIQSGKASSAQQVSKQMLDFILVDPEFDQSDFVHFPKLFCSYETKDNPFKIRKKGKLWALVILFPYNLKSTEFQKLPLINVNNKDYKWEKFPPNNLDILF